MKIFRTRPQPTFKYFYLGSILIIGGISLLFAYSLLLGVTLLIFGIFILLSLSGVLFDFDNKRVKIYTNFLFLKFGEWTPLSQFTHVVLGPNSSSISVGRTSQTFRTNSYSISLLSKTNKTIELKEFTDYTKALQYLELIAQQSGIPPINKQEIITQIAAKKRKSRK